MASRDQSGSPVLTQHAIPPHLLSNTEHHNLLLDQIAQSPPQPAESISLNLANETPAGDSAAMSNVESTTNELVSQAEDSVLPQAPDLLPNAEYPPPPTSGADAPEDQAPQEREETRIPTEATPEDSQPNLETTAGESAQHAIPETDAMEDSTPHWVLFADDMSEPTQAELEAVKDTEIENDATNVAAHEKVVFTEIDDPDQRPTKKLRLSWIINGVRGTKDRPNRAEVMHSPPAFVDGLYWRIKFFPRGNKCSSISGYIECSKKIPEPDKEEPEGRFLHFESPPNGDISFDAIPKKHIKIKTRRKDSPQNSSSERSKARRDESFKANSDTSETIEKAAQSPTDSETTEQQGDDEFRVSAQLGMVIYNPNEPRSATCQSSEHLFCASNNDWGWSNLAGKWDEIHQRQPGQRQALLKGDTIAIDAYIRIFEDPAQSLFWHNSSDEPEWPSKALAGVLPMGTPPLYYSPGVAGITALLFLKPFREILQSVDCEGWRRSSEVRPRPFIARLQCVLHEMRHGGKSDFVDVYPVLEALREVGETYQDVVTFWEVFRRAIELELEGEIEILAKIAAIFDLPGGRCPPLEIPVSSVGSLQESLNKLGLPSQDSLKELHPSSQDSPKELHFSSQASLKELDSSSHDALDKLDSSSQNALDKLDLPSPDAPDFLPILLQRQEFDQTKREWVLRHEKITLNDEITLPFGIGQKYILYGFLVHVGARNSGRFYTILRPNGPKTHWLAFEDSDGNKIYSYTRKTLETYEGLAGDDLKKFSSTRETCYLAMYIKADKVGDYLGPLEPYTAPDWLKAPMRAAFDATAAPSVNLEFYQESSIVGCRGLLDMFNVKQEGRYAWCWSLSPKTSSHIVRKQIADHLEVTDPRKVKLYTIGYGEAGEYGNARWYPINLKKPLSSWQGSTAPICIWVSILQNESDVERFGDPDPQPKKSKKKSKTSRGTSEPASDILRSTHSDRVLPAPVSSEEESGDHLSAPALLQTSEGHETDATTDQAPNDDDLSAELDQLFVEELPDLAAAESGQRASDLLSTADIDESIEDVVLADSDGALQANATVSVPIEDLGPLTAFAREWAAGYQPEPVTPAPQAANQPPQPATLGASLDITSLTPETSPEVTLATIEASSEAPRSDLAAFQILDEMSLAVTHGHLVDAFPGVEEVIANAVESQDRAAQQYATSPEDEAAIAALIAADTAELSGMSENGDQAPGDTPVPSSRNANYENSQSSPAGPEASLASKPAEQSKKRRPIVYGFLQKFDTAEQTFIASGNFFAYRNENVRKVMERCLPLHKVVESHRMEDSKAMDSDIEESGTTFSDVKLWYRTSTVDGTPIKDNETFDQIDFVNGADLIFGLEVGPSAKAKLRTAGLFWDPFELSKFLQLQSRKHPRAVTVNHTTIFDYGQEQYEGPLVNGHRHGALSKLTYSNGQTYEGPLVCGMREGPNGFMTYQNGDTYRGDWKEDEKDGQGTLIEKGTGNKYEGGFRNGKQWGRGVTHWAVAADEADLCQICYTDKINALFFDCGHVGTCMECAKQCECCPICRKEIKQVVKMFRF
ncbi:uncharacterized protein AB675_5744 [Cyphellophora attinorum]|uniref:RING-type domain-containing protein n=1 Tax=Cyphellophora attinorum TaxID=1664694 RepID=A0A0N1H2S1_9EURO|nr:uncharacterized protein AB675_5744 [Phialophora attinorum]KPI38884.1 hypothetical protein AB675_5744 [Phialophora attinorum]